MVKKLLLTGILGIFSGALFGQVMNSEYAMYMYSGRFSNPALSGIKEYGTSLSYQTQFITLDDDYSSIASLRSHQIELGQSLFKGRGGLELQWNHSELRRYHSDNSLALQRNLGALAYSHGFQLGDRLILRAGLRGRFYSHIYNWSLINGVDPLGYPGNDMQFSWDAGLSLHHKQGYLAIGSFHHNPVYLKELAWTRFYVGSPTFTGEMGAMFALPFQKEKNWKWSIQPFLKGYILENAMFLSFGSFVNYGPFQFGAMLTSAESWRIAIGLNHTYLRLSYAYAGKYMALSSVNQYSLTPNHELALRFILPGKDKEAGFMKIVYRGF